MLARRATSASWKTAPATRAQSDRRMQTSRNSFARRLARLSSTTQIYTTHHAQPLGHRFCRHALIQNCTHHVHLKARNTGARSSSKAGLAAQPAAAAMVRPPVQLGGDVAHLLLKRSCSACVLLTFTSGGRCNGMLLIAVSTGISLEPPGLLFSVGLNTLLFRPALPRLQHHR